MKFAEKMNLIQTVHEFDRKQDLIRTFHEFDAPKYQKTKRKKMLAPLGMVKLGETFYLEKKEDGKTKEVVSFYISFYKQFVSIDFTFAPNIKEMKQLNPNGKERHLTSVVCGRQCWKELCSMGFVQRKDA